MYVNDGTIINESSGIIDLKVDGSNFSYTGGNTHVLNNSGLIKCTVPTGTANLSVLLNNNNGTISVESGVLTFTTQSKFLNNGVYNVATNASLTSNIQTVLSGTLTGVLDGAILWNNEVNVPTGTTANLNFTGNTGVKWRDGSLNGGGTLVNKSEISMLTNASKYIYSDTNLNNEGIINHKSDGVLYINDGIINNQSTGVIDLQAEGTSLSYTGGSTHIINNYGIIKRSVTTGVSSFVAQLYNFDGVIIVDSGILNFSGLVKNLTDGDYNIATGSSLLWNTQIVCAGTLEGLLDGDISWNSEVNVPSTATFNFDGGIGVNWNDGSLNGGGTLMNAGELTLLSPSSKYIYSNSNLNNTGVINYESNGVLYINDGTLNNQTDGVIDAKFDGTLLSYTGGSTHTFNNAGLLKKSAGTGATAFNALSTNSGIIDVQSGTLNFVDSFVLNNTTDGIIKGIATIDIPSAANFTNNGTFAPGGSPGTLNVLGNYQSTSTTEIEIELFGLTAGSDFDVLSVTGNAIFDGSVNVLMNFDAAINDEFIVATTTGTISQCSLQPITTGTFNGSIYTFDVICRNGNQVVLKVNNITLGSEEITLSNLTLYPNPSNGNFTIDLGREYTDVSVEIYNMLGQLISAEKYASAKTIEQEINASAGIYLVKVSTAKEVSNILRIIKQ